MKLPNLETSMNSNQFKQSAAGISSSNHYKISNQKQVYSEVQDDEELILK